MSMLAVAAPPLPHLTTACAAEQGNARTPGAAAATPGGPDSYAYTPAGQTPGAYAPAPTPGAQDPAAPVAPSPGSHYQEPTPGMGITPGLTPGLGGYTPEFTPGMAYTPGLEGATPGGLPGTPGFGMGGPGWDGSGVGQIAGGLGAPGVPPGPRRPDYKGVLVKMPDGGVGVAGDTDPSGNTEAVPQGGGAVVLLDVIELCEAERKDWVKVVSGEYQGKVGQVVAFDGTEMVLEDGDVVDSSIVGKLAVPPDGQQHGR